MKTIIRIEHPRDGWGIWRSKDENGDNYIDRLSNISSFVSRHYDFPTPLQEGLDRSSNLFCAFKSIEQLQEWVYTSEIKELISFGFKIYMIDVKLYLEGRYQILFDKEDILQKKDITELFK